MSEYKPLNRNEMLLLPRLKAQKYDANMGKLIDLAQKMGTYMEVNETDDLYYYQFEQLAKEMKLVASGDLAEKDAEVQKLDFQGQKIIRDFETREKDGITKLRIKSSSKIYSQPKEFSPIHQIGRYDPKQTFLVSQHDSKFYKVIHRGRNGYVSINDVQRK